MNIQTSEIFKSVMIIESAFLFILFKSVQSKINTSLAKTMCIKISILNKTKKENKS